MAKTSCFQHELQRGDSCLSVADRCPFTLQRFDSVLATKLDGMSFTTGLVTPRDGLYQWVETVERAGVICIQSSVWFILTIR